jgi:glycosyltransferase involved in cell wall biosynthesis
MGCPSLKELHDPPRDKTGWPWTEASPQLPVSLPDGSSWPRISIVTPSYNQGRFIEETIRSVLLQGYPNLEYIIIDGGSSDDSVDIIKKYEPWLGYWVSESDNGQYDAINKGFAVSTGNVMIWLNSDDMLVENGLMAVGSIFARFAPKVQWVTGLPAYWDEQGRLLRILTPLHHNRLLMRLGCYEGRALSWVMQECTAWSSNLWELVGARVNADLTYAADFDLWCRFARYADLFSVSALIGGNRQRIGQKTELQGAYDAEVDLILRRNRLCFIVNRIFRNRIARMLARTYLRTVNMHKCVHYNARKMHWEIFY